jgi:hypothetical protein
MELLSGQKAGHFDSAHLAARAGPSDSTHPATGQVPDMRYTVYKGEDFGISIENRPE